jgi:sigma-B regulation protein RsbU (phosphoserine phosphatase)
MFYSIGRAIASLDEHDLLSEFESVADRIQRSLLDVKVPAVAGLEVGYRAAPARIVGGDYLDVIERPGDQPLFAIGDVSGKSLPAALRAMTLKYLTRGLVSVLGGQMTEALARANDVICADIEPDTFVTFCLATMSPDQRTLIVANAGHDPPLIYRPGTVEVEQLEPSGLALGVMEGFTYRQQTAPLGRGDVIAFYTDGFTEARNPQGEQFTLAHVKDGLLEYRDLPAQQLADALFERIEHYAAGTLNDDATIIIVRVVE